MRAQHTAVGRFTQLHGLRQNYLKRAEKYARYTLPRVCPPDNYDINNDSLNYDWHSVGAQATNHLVNKLMLTLFAPSRPFMRLSMTSQDMAQLLAQLQLDASALEEWFAEGERSAIKELDSRPIRSHLYDALQHLVIIGDTLLYLPRDEPDAGQNFNIKDYVLRRTPSGRLAELIVRQQVYVGDLDPKALAEYRVHHVATNTEDDELVCVFHWIKRAGKDKVVDEQWVENVKLSDHFTSDYNDDDCPWVPLAWNHKRGQNYGSGLVEDYSGDFAALSSLAQAEVEGALLSSEFRWLVNPGGATKIEDLNSSRNGDALPGLDGDVVLITNSKPNDLKVVADSAESRIRRIGHGFLMPTAMTRDAERVTAEEIRQQALELETGLGGVYTRLAGSMQPAIARWLMHLADLKLKGSKIKLTIVTGLDALSRNGDLAALRAALGDLASLNQLGQSLNVLKIAAVVSSVFLGHGLNPAKYVKSQEEQAADQQAAEAAQDRETAANAAIQSTGQQ